MEYVEIYAADLRPGDVIRLDDKFKTYKIEKIEVHPEQTIISFEGTAWKYSATLYNKVELYIGHIIKNRETTFTEFLDHDANTGYVLKVQVPGDKRECVVSGNAGGIITDFTLDAGDIAALIEGLGEALEFMQPTQITKEPPAIERLTELVANFSKAWEAGVIPVDPQQRKEFVDTSVKLVTAMLQEKIKEKT